MTDRVHDSYESDFYAWANAQAELLRTGRLDRADLEAARQTGLAEEAFPAECPFTAEQALDDGWWPA